VKRVRALKFNRIAQLNQEIPRSGEMGALRKKIVICRRISIFSRTERLLDFLARKLTKNLPQVRKYRDFSLFSGYA
jgi:hypothetical protein